MTDMASFPVTATACGVSFVPLVLVPLVIVAVKYYAPPEVGCLARPKAKPEPEGRAEGEPPALPPGEESDWSPVD